MLVETHRKKHLKILEKWLKNNQRVEKCVECECSMLKYNDIM